MWGSLRLTIIIRAISQRRTFPSLSIRDWSRLFKDTWVMNFCQNYCSWQLRSCMCTLTSPSHLLLEPCPTIPLNTCSFCPHLEIASLSWHSAILWGLSQCRLPKGAGMHRSLWAWMTEEREGRKKQVWNRKLDNLTDLVTWSRLWTESLLKQNHEPHTPPCILLFLWMVIIIIISIPRNSPGYFSDNDIIKI